MLRDLESFQSIAGNNFFLFVVLLMQQPESALFFLLIFGLLVLVPLSGDPFRKIPANRLALWPLDARQRVFLRTGALGLSPIAWITVALIAWKARIIVALQFLALAIVLQVITRLAGVLVRRLPRWNLLRDVPALPWTYGEFLRKDLRQMLNVLDVYVALVLASGTVCYRLLASTPDPAALRVLSILVAFALSTYAQCLFGLDGTRGIARYRLLPISGWRILLVKDIAFAIVLVVLVLPLRPLPGIAGGLMALAIGHHTSVRRIRPQHRWRFTAGRLIPVGVLQALFVFALGTVVDTGSPLWALLCVPALIFSLWFYGRAWDRMA